MATGDGGELWRVARSGVRYVLVVENGCREAAGPGPCPSPVNNLSVTLNGQIVFQAESSFEDHRARLPVDAVAANQDNRLTITAAGTPRSAARVRILATPMNKPRSARGVTSIGHRDAGSGAARPGPKTPLPAL